MGTTLVPLAPPPASAIAEPWITKTIDLLRLGRIKMKWLRAFLAAIRDWINPEDFNSWLAEQYELEATIEAQDYEENCQRWRRGARCAESGGGRMGGYNSKTVELVSSEGEE